MLPSYDIMQQNIVLRLFDFFFASSNQIRGQIEGKTEGHSDSSLYGASGRP